MSQDKDLELSNKKKFEEQQFNNRAYFGALYLAAIYFQNLTAMLMQEMLQSMANQQSVDHAVAQQPEQAQKMAQSQQPDEQTNDRRLFDTIVVISKEINEVHQQYREKNREALRAFFTGAKGQPDEEVVSINDKYLSGLLEEEQYNQEMLQVFTKMQQGNSPQPVVPQPLANEQYSEELPDTLGWQNYSDEADKEFISAKWRRVQQVVHSASSYQSCSPYEQQQQDLALLKESLLANIGDYVHLLSEKRVELQQHNNTGQQVSFYDMERMCNTQHTSVQNVFLNTYGSNYNSVNSVFRTQQPQQQPVVTPAAAPSVKKI